MLDNRIFHYRDKRAYLIKRVTDIIVVSLVAIVLISIALVLARLEVFFYIRAVQKGTIDDPLLWAFMVFVGLIGLLFLWVGMRAIWAVIQDIRHRLPEDVDLDREPWLANDAWRERRILHKGLAGISPIARGFIVLIVIVVVAVGIALFLASAREGNWLTAFFALLTPGTLVTVIGYLYLRNRKFGTSICHLKTLPAVIGDALKVEVETRFPDSPDGPVKATLTNLTIYTFAGRYLRKKIHWQTERSIPVTDLKWLSESEVQISVEIEIPEHVREQQGGEGSFWRLQLSAPFPSVNYMSEFTVPVYDVH